MSMLDKVFSSYPDSDPLSHQFTVALTATIATAGLFRLVVNLAGFEMEPLIRYICSYSACYIAMIAVIGCARSRYFSPYGSKLEFLRSFMTSVIAMILWIGTLYICEYYVVFPTDLNTHSLLYRSLGLAIPLNGALIFGTGYSDRS